MRPHTRPTSTRHPHRRSTRPASSPALLEERERTRSAAAGEAASPGLAVALRSDLVRPRLTVVGELDLSSAGLLTAMLDHVCGRPDRASAACEVDLDLAGVSFTDIHGLAPVLDSGARVVATSGPVRRVLRLLSDEPQAVRWPA